MRGRRRLDPKVGADLCVSVTLVSRTGMAARLLVTYIACIMPATLKVRLSPWPGLMVSKSCSKPLCMRSPRPGLCLISIL